MTLDYANRLIAAKFLAEVKTRLGESYRAMTEPQKLVVADCCTDGAEMIVDSIASGIGSIEREPAETLRKDRLEINQRLDSLGSAALMTKSTFWGVVVSGANNAVKAAMQGGMS